SCRREGIGAGRELDRLGPARGEVVGRYPGVRRALAPVEVDVLVDPGQDGGTGQVRVVVVLRRPAGVGRYHVADALVVEHRPGTGRVLEVLHPERVRPAAQYPVHAEGRVLQRPAVDDRVVVDVYADSVVHGAGKPVQAGGQHVGTRPADHEVVRRDLRRGRALAPVEGQVAVVADQVRRRGRDGRDAAAVVPVLAPPPGRRGLVTGLEALRYRRVAGQREDTGEGEQRGGQYRRHLHQQPAAPRQPPVGPG